MRISEEAKKKRQEYQREWRKRNKDKVRQYNESYWEKQANGQKDEHKERIN